jgi:2-hydroxychromene-2-carboxylate isomerase
MPAPIEFWFDFSSGYAYFAAQEIDALAARHGRTVLWRPFMLGAAFKVTGAMGLSRTPMKGDYARRDWARIARLKKLPLVFHPDHPITQLPATRAYYWIEREQPDQAQAFARAAFNAYFGDGRDLRDPAVVAELARPLGIDSESLRVGMTEPAIKDRAKALSDQALAKNVFGSPFFTADGEPFWGWDLLPMLDQWLSTGGW